MKFKVYCDSESFGFQTDSKWLYYLAIVSVWSTVFTVSVSIVVLFYGLAKMLDGLK